MRTRLLSGSVLFLVLLTAIAWPRPVVAEDAIVVYSAGIDAMLVDGKDRVLLDALKLIDERIMDLPAELDEPDIPAPMIKMALEMLMSPMSLRAGIMEDADPALGPPFYAQLVVQSDEETAGRQVGMLNQLLGMAMGPMEGAPVEGVAGMMQYDLDGVPMYLGSTDIGGSSAFVVALNKLEAAPPKVRSVGLPANVKPVFAMHVDAAALQPFIEMGLAQAPPMEAEMARSQLAMYGILGERPMVLDLVSGYGRDRAHSYMRYGNYAAVGTNAAMLVREPLTEKDLSMVPADASFAEVWRMNWMGIMDMLDMMAMQMTMGEEFAASDMPEIDEALEAFREFTGVDLEQDLLAHLGHTTGLYMSDATGGGGLMSMVGFIEVSHPQEFGATLDRLASKVNEMARQEAEGYIRIETRRLADRDITTLLFPGLPVPLELSWAIEGGYWWMGASPQSVIAAIGQSRRPGHRLLDNPRFKEMGGTDIGSATTVIFADTERLVGEGYGLATLGMAALANVLRSPTDEARDPGLIMPSFGELTRGVKPSLTIYRLDGDDLVVTSQGDRSALVNLTATAGLIGGSTSGIAMAALGMGVTLPALAKARENAKEVKSATQLRQMGMVIQIYASENDDRLPENLEVLVDEQYIEPDLLRSPLGPIGDGGGDYWLNLNVEKLADVTEPSRFILGYDRAAYANSNRVCVLFFDGHVESIDSWELPDLFGDPLHEGIDFNLPGDW